MKSVGSNFVNLVNFETDHANNPTQNTGFEAVKKGLSYDNQTCGAIDAFNGAQALDAPVPLPKINQTIPELSDFLLPKITQGAALRVFIPFLLCFKQLGHFHFDCGRVCFTFCAVKDLAAGADLIQLVDVKKMLARGSRVSNDGTRVPGKLFVRVFDNAVCPVNIQEAICLYQATAAFP